jgi:putative addiction module component (TIGR02574 family)
MSISAEIDQMSPVERLKTMELLWDRLVRDAEAVDSPSWHGEILEGRLEKIREGKATFLSLDEVRRRLDRAS